MNLLNATFEDFLNNPENSSKFVLWNYFTEKNIYSIDFVIIIFSKNKKINNNISNL